MDASTHRNKCPSVKFNHSDSLTPLSRLILVTTISLEIYKISLPTVRFQHNSIVLRFDDCLIFK